MLRPLKADIWIANLNAVASPAPEDSPVFE
jgi:hypothetical protein